MSLFCFYFLFLYTHLILIAHFYKRTDELLQISPLMIHISLPVTRGLPRVKKKKKRKEYWTHLINQLTLGVGVFLN